MAWYHRFLNALRSDRTARDIEREVSFHLAERADALAATGMPSDDAAREARRRFGNPGVVQERARDIDVVAWIASSLADCRYAFRALRAAPGFSLVAILSLALGIGANTAIFSLTNALILKSLPVNHPEQLMHVHMDSASGASFTYPLWEQIRDRTSSFSGAVAHSATSFNLTQGGTPRRTNGAWVSGDFFRVLGVRTVAGRLISTVDDQRGCAPVAVVSEGFADRELGGASSAVGKALALNGQSFSVIGVSDNAFFGLSVGRTSNVFVPMCAQTLLYGPKVLDARSRWYIDILLRPNEGITRPQLNARLAAIAPSVFEATLPQNWSAADQRGYLKQSLGAEPGATGMSDLRQTYSLALYTLAAVVAMVLLIACANIANLLLARAAARQREIAIRMAMGAGRGRLIRQLLTESLLLAVIGAALGAVFATWATRFLIQLLSTSSRIVFLDLSIDGRMLLFTMLVTAGTAALFGLIPAWRATRVDPQAAMKAGGRGVIGGDARHRLGRALVVGQVSLSLALLAASGLLLGSFRNLVTIDPGFRRDGVTIATFKFPKDSKAAELLAMKRDALTRLRSLPGVASASVSVLTPIGNMGWNDIVAVAGYTPTKQADSIAYENQVSEGYFETLGTPIIAGRDISPGDISLTRPVAVINETMARRFFAGSNPIGKNFRTQVGDTLSSPHEIIGIVGDAKYQSLSEATPATLYYPLGQGDIEGNESQFELRSSNASAASLGSGIRAVAAAINPTISVDLTTLSTQVSASLARPRLLAMLSGFFGVLALLLAVIGLYGTMSYDVARRRNEIGIRMALGAASSQVMRMVVGEAGALVVIGVLCGGAIAFATTRFVSTLLFGLTPTDPMVFAISALALGVVAMAAAYLPASRASKQDPMTALREE